MPGELCGEEDEDRPLTFITRKQIGSVTKSTVINWSEFQLRVAETTGVTILVTVTCRVETNVICGLVCCGCCQGGD